MSGARCEVTWGTSCPWPTTPPYVHRPRRQLQPPCLPPPRHLGHPRLQLTIKLSRRARQLGVTVHTGNLGYTIIWSVDVFDLYTIAVAEIAGEVAHASPDVEGTVHALLGPHAGAAGWSRATTLRAHLLISLARRHISYCFLGFTCFLKTCLRPGCWPPAALSSSVSNCQGEASRTGGRGGWRSCGSSSTLWLHPEDRFVLRWWPTVPRVLSTKV